MMLKMETRFLALDAEKLFADPHYLSMNEVAIIEGCSYEAVRRRILDPIKGDILHGCVRKMGGRRKIDRERYALAWGEGFEQLLAERREWFKIQRAKKLTELEN